jgi:hypothetical protein
MGLAERRRIAKIKDEHAPRFQRELNEAVSFELPFELDLASFPENTTILDCYDYYFESYGPGLVVKVMAGVCVDQLGRDAVKAKFDKIVFQNTAKSPEEKGELSVTIENRTLFVRESFYGYSDLLFGEDTLKQKLESML